MAYKFQSGLARLNGTIALDGANDKLQLSGGIEFADKSIDVADLNLAAGTNYNLGGGADGALAHTDELILMDDSDSDSNKVLSLAQLGTYMSGVTAVTGAFGASMIQAVKIGVNADNDLLELADGALTVNGTIAAATSFTIGSAVMSEADLEQLDGITAGTVAASKAVVVNATKDATSFNSLTAVAVTGSVSVSSPSGSITDLFVGDDLEVKGNLISHAANTAHGVATHNANVNVTGTIGATHVVATGLSASAAVSGLTLDIESTANVAGVLTAGGLTVGSAVMSEADLEKLDGITDGTAAAGKAMVLDASLDIAGARDISGRTVSGSGNATFLGNAAFDGSVTAGTSIIIGSADLNEADLEKLDGITNGTVAANKAVVVDANKDAGGFRNITAVQIGHADDADLLTLADGKLTIKGDVDIQGAFNRVTTNATELAVEDVRIIIGSGSAGASQLDGGGIFFGSPGAGKSIAEIAFNDAAEDELIFAFSGSEAMKIDSGGDLTVQGDGTVEGALSGAAGTFDALGGTSLALQGGGISAAGAIAGATTVAASGLGTFDGGLNVDDAFTVTAAGAVVAVGVNAGGAVTGVTSLGASGVVTAAGFTIGSAVINEADLEQLDDITAGSVAASKAVVVNSDSDISGFRNVQGTGMSMFASGAFGDVGMDTLAVGGSGGTAALTVSAAGVVQAAGGITSAGDSVSSNMSAGHQVLGGTVRTSGSLILGHSSSFLAGGSLQYPANVDLIGGLVSSSRIHIVSGSVSAANFPSYLAVAPSGSEDIKLFLPVHAASEAGKMLTIKYQSLSDGAVVLTGSGASNMTFDGLAALTMSSPMAAVNLMWNGTGYDIY